MRVCTWNVRHGWRPDTRRPDLDALAAACAALDVDVLALQEVHRGTRRVGGADLLAVVADATGLTPVDGPVRHRDTGTYGNALLVRGEPSDVATLALPRPWWPPWKRRPEPRGALRCRLGGTGRGIVVATCHLGFGRPGEGARQLAATLRWVEEAAGDGPAVLAGDLNLRHPQAPPGWALVDVPKAFPAWAPDRTIDHVLVWGGTGRALDAPRPVVSDHRPVVVELELGAGSGARPT
jgi:endonuclease/exonuclease/phosphatase family metal-dependent hydrolase